MNRETVIKGLECCIKESEHLYDNPCKNCPYYTGHNDCKVNQLHRDAIALLKEQEEEICFLKAMQLRTVKGMDEGELGRMVRETLGI